MSGGLATDRAFPRAVAGTSLQRKDEDNGR